MGIASLPCGGERLAGDVLGEFLLRITGLAIPRFSPAKARSSCRTISISKAECRRPKLVPLTCRGREIVAFVLNGVADYYATWLTTTASGKLRAARQPTRDSRGRTAHGGQRCDPPADDDARYGRRCGNCWRRQACRFPRNSEVVQCRSRQGELAASFVLAERPSGLRMAKTAKAKAARTKSPATAGNLCLPSPLAPPPRGAYSCVGG